MSAISSPQISTAARKANGVVYTPPHVARYIVRQTLDPLLADKSVEPQSTLRVLDPACGEGVFLIEAFHYLLAHYRRLYIGSENREKHCRAGRLKLASDGLWHLTAAERKQILQKHIYGVELNAEAALAARGELARLACGNGCEQRELVDILKHNIRIGDALIESDFYDDAPSDKDRVATFDWSTEFDGPFDAIVGNPPYVNIRLLSKHHGPAVKRYLQNRYRCAHRAYDLYVLFLERAQSLLKPGGTCGMIVPNKLATLDYAQPCRRLLVEETTLLRVDDVSGLDIFPGTNVYPYIVVW